MADANEAEKRKFGLLPGHWSYYVDDLRLVCCTIGIDTVFPPNSSVTNLNLRMNYRTIKTSGNGELGLMRGACILRLRQLTRNTRQNVLPMESIHRRPGDGGRC